MIVGGAVVAVGATLLILDAARTQPDPLDVGLDPGLGGARGRAGQLVLESEEAFMPFSALMLGGGALLQLVGIILVFGGDDGGQPDSKPAKAATVEPLVGPGFGGVRGSF